MYVVFMITLHRIKLTIPILGTTNLRDLRFPTPSGIELNAAQSECEILATLGCEDDSNRSLLIHACVDNVLVGTRRPMYFSSH